MESREDVTASIKAVRVSRTGLTKGTIDAQQSLMRILATTDPVEGVARLSAAVDRLTQVENPAHRDDARGLRAALGIGLPQLKNVTARRDAAKQQQLFTGERRTQYDAEDRAIKRLVDLLFEEAHQRAPATVEVDAFTEATEQQLANPDLVAPPLDDEAQFKHEAPDPVERPTQTLPPTVLKLINFYRNLFREIRGNGSRPDQGPSSAAIEAPNFLQAIRTLVTEKKQKRPLPKTEREYVARMAVIAGMAVFMAVVLTVGLTGSTPSWLRGSSGASSSPSAPGLWPAATVTNSPAEKIDNTGGWGPSRKTFTGAAPYAVLNSITNMPGHGDERSFIACHDLANNNQAGSGWGSSVIAQDQHTYQCELYFDNDVSPTFDPSPSPGSHRNIAVMLQNTRARVQLPSPITYNPALYGILNADNSNPPEVWDACNFIAPKPVTLTYIPGSAHMFTDGLPKDGVALKDDTSLTGDGAPLGDNQDGYLGQHAGYILFNVAVSLG